MTESYDNRDGYIWLDGNMVPWRDANIHVLTHALHYASSVFEGERAYNGKIFKSQEHSKRLIASGKMLDMPIPYSVKEIEDAKYKLECYSEHELVIPEHPDITAEVDKLLQKMAEAHDKLAVMSLHYGEKKADKAVL